MFSSAAAAKFVGSSASTKRTSTPRERKDFVELGVGSSVECVGRDDVIASFGKVDNGVEDGGSAGADGETAQGMAPLQLGVSALENVSGGVHETGINVSEFLQAE